MACGSETSPKFENAPPSYRSTVWQHFGFSIDYKDQGKKLVKKNKTVCKHCLTSAPYLTSNTTNMTSHLRRDHPDKLSASGTDMGTDKVMRPKSQSITEAFQKNYSFASDKHKKITHAIGTFIAKALQPYSVVENEGFHYLMKTVDA